MAAAPADDPSPPPANTPVTGAPVPVAPVTVALVVGATGYVGGAVVAEARARGLVVLAHARADSPRLARRRAEFERLGAEIVTTPWEGAAFRALIDARGVSIVFLCLGTTRRRMLSREASGARPSYESVDSELSRLVIDAAASSAAPPRVVLVSTARANARSRWRYLAVRGRLEEHLTSSGVPWTIARPSFISGPDRDEFRPLERLGAQVADWSLLWLAVLGMQILRERYRSIGAGELAKALVSYGREPSAAGKIVHGERLRDFP